MYSSPIAILCFLLLPVYSFNGSNITFQHKTDLQGRGYKGGGGGGGHEMYWMAEKDSGHSDLLPFLLLLLAPLALAAILLPSGASLFTSMMAMMQAMNNGQSPPPARGYSTNVWQLRSSLAADIFKVWQQVEQAIDKHNRE